MSAKKSLGQNFLLDLNLTARIARAGGPLDGVTVVEVGPGPGGLTRALLASGARRVIAVERDSRAVAALAEIAAHYPGRLVAIPGDALALDIAPHLDGGPARIAANLPYNISTALLVSWLGTEPWPPWCDMMVLMFQREVAERIVAKPGDRPYRPAGGAGRLAHRGQDHVRRAPRAFVPPPKVTSSVVRLIPRANPLPCTRTTLERVTAAAFGQRRKMLRQSLRSLGVDPAPLLAAVGIDPASRAEAIPVEGFVALANALDATPGLPQDAAETGRCP